MRLPPLRPAGSTFRRPGGRDGYVALYAQRTKDPAYPPDPDDDVVCPFDFVEVPGQDAEAAIAGLRQREPNRTPILFGSPYEAGMMLERHDGSRQFTGKSAVDWLRDAETFDLDAWFSERVETLKTWQSNCGEVIPARGKWPRNAATYNRLTIPNERLVPGPKPSVIIGLLPTRDPTETAAYLGFGGWNDCPPPPVHILLARQWHERYGAVLVTNTYETVEFQVAKPLTDREDAISLAMEQFHWCSDSVPETLQHAAAELIGSTVWVFWWD